MEFYSTQIDAPLDEGALRTEMISVIYQGILEATGDHWDAERACWQAEGMMLSELARWVQRFIRQHQ